MQDLLAVGTEARFASIIVILTGIVTLLGVLGRGGWKATKLILRQVDAIEDNTKAVRELADRVNKIEGKIDA